MPKIKIILLITFLVFSFFAFGKVEAGTTDNVSGFAWSENIGWISFNCTNPELPVPRCSNDYGVKIDPSTGIFSGYAWSENIGWISFNVGELTGCPSGTCQAQLTFATKQVSGWAKVLSNNSWIRLRDTNYGVSWNNSTQELEGWAWSDTDVGWISFNRTNCDANKDGLSDGTPVGCPSAGTPISNYKVLTSFTLALPDTIVDSGPSSSTNSTTSTFTFHGTNSPTSYQCKLDTGSWAVCTSSKSYTVVQSSHTFNVKAVNAFGEDPSPAIWNWLVDTTKPVVSVFNVSPTTLNVATPTATISWTVTDSGGSYLDHVEVWRAPDSGGVPGAWSQIGSSYPAPANSNSWSSNTTDSPADGIYWYGIHVLDKANNQGTESTSIKVLVDKTAPSSSVTNPAAGTWFNNDFTATLDDSDAGPSGLAASCQYLIVGLNPSGSDCSSGILSRNCDPVNKNVAVGSGACSAFNICIFEGQNRCRVNTQSFDNAGNFSGWQSRNFSIDYTPPVVGQVSPTSTIKGVATTFSAAVSDSVSQIFGCWFYVEGALTTSTVNYSSIPCTSCTASTTYTFNEIRSYNNVFFTCMDAAQNYTSGSSVTVQVAAPPTLFVSLSAHPPVGVTSLSDVDLTATVSGTITGTINYYFDCNTGTGDCTADYGEANWSVDCNKVVLGTTTNPYTAVGLCDYPAVGNYTAKVFIERGSGNAQATTAISVVSNQPPVCQISVPKNGVVNQWIDINVSGSSDPEGGLVNVNFSSDQTLNGSSDGSWDSAGPYSWTVSSGNWNAVNKTIKWSFSSAGVYETWARLTDNVGLTGSCYTTTTITACLSGDTKTCTSLQGCDHTLICQANAWPSCPADECSLGSTKICTGGTQICSASCSWGPCSSSDSCTLPAPYCPTCYHAACSGSTWSCQPDSLGTDCGDCRICNSTGGCTYVCPEICVADSCVSCSAYDGGCGYGYCGNLEIPSWSYSGGICQYTCQPNVSCEEENPPQPPEEPCQRQYPNIGLTPSLQSGTAGQQLFYTVRVENKDTTNCGDSTFSLAKSCPSGWPGCSLDLSSLTISPNQSKSTTLRVTSPSCVDLICPDKNNYGISVAATNNSSSTYFRTGYAVYQITNNPPQASVSCYPQGCDQSAGACTGYTWTSFCLKNNSTDPDGPSDIENSIWTITGQMQDTSDCSVSGNPVCSWTLPFNFSAGDYSAQLYVEDTTGASDIASKSFSILQDIIAEFDCSLNSEGPWQDCDTLRASEGEIVYFRDKSTPSDSDGGSPITITSRSWTFEDGTPGSSIQQYPYSSFKKVDQGSGSVTLTVTDSAGRSKTVTYQVWVTIPLPEWKETPPL